MAGAEIKPSTLNDAANWGLRATVGVLFILHGYTKIGNEGFAGWLPSLGIPAEMAMLIALAEVIPGILLIIGVLTRISSAVLSIIMVGAIFHVKGASSITGDGGFELDLILLAASLVIIVAGPGRASISHVAKKIPRFLH